MPNLGTLDRIADALGVETWQLLVPQIEPHSLPQLMPRELRDPKARVQMRNLVRAVAAYTGLRVVSETK